MTTQGTQDRAAGPLSPAYRLTTVGLVGLVTLVAFESMAVGTAMPTVARALDGLGLYGWAFTAFLTGCVVGLVLSGLVCDGYGPRRAVLLGLGAFAGGLLVAGFASHMEVFVAGRAVQGVGAGLVSVASWVVIGEVYPDRTRPRVFALISAAWVVPSLVGPVVAGFLAGQGWWRAVFLGLVPLLALALASLLPTLRTLTPGPRGDAAVRWSRLLYAALTAAGLAAFQLGTQRVADGVDLWVPVLLVVGVLLAVAGLRVLWPAGTVRLRRGIPALVGFRGLMAGAFFGLESLVPLTLSTLHGYSPTAAGLPLTIGALGWMAGATVQGRSRAARHHLVRIGAACVTTAAAGMLVLALVDGAGWVTYPVWVVGGFGMGIGLSTLNVLLLDFSDPAERGENSASAMIAEQTVAAVTIGAGGSLVAASALGAFSFATAIAVHDVVLFALVAVAVAAARQVRRPVAARA